MKKDIHPDYEITTVKCVCGSEFQTRSTLKEIEVEICSACHPFFTGQQKLIDSAGRVERFMRKYGTEYGGGDLAGGKPAPAKEVDDGGEKGSDKPAAETAAAADESKPEPEAQPSKEQDKTSE